MKLALNQESVDALIDFSDAITKSKNDILESTDSLLRYAETLEDDLGVHRTQLIGLLKSIKICLINTTEAFEVLPKKLIYAAQLIQEYIGDNDSSEDPQKVLKLR